MITVKLRRMPETENPLNTCLHWEEDKVLCTRLVLQENETGEIVVSTQRNVTIVSHQLQVFFISTLFK